MNIFVEDKTKKRLVTAEGSVVTRQGLTKHAVLYSGVETEIVMSGPPRGRCGGGRGRGGQSHNEVSLVPPNPSFDKSTDSIPVVFSL